MRDASTTVTKANPAWLTWGTAKPGTPPVAPQKPMREDARLWLIGPKFAPSSQRLTFLPEEPKREFMPHAQRVIRDLRDHVHDPNWCYGRPKSDTGFQRDLPPLANGVVRYDTFSEPAIEDPEAEKRWLIATQFAKFPETLQLLREANLDGTLLADDIAESTADEEPVEYATRMSSAVLRRIEWEQEQAQNGHRFKFYLAGDASGDYVTWWASNAAKASLTPPDAIWLDATMQKVADYTARRGITLADAEDAIRDRRGRYDFYGRDHLYSRLAPKTIAAFFADDDAKASFWKTHMPDEDPYREAFVSDDDDLHRPEPGYESNTIIAEINEAQADARNKILDFSMGDLDERGQWRLDRKYVDILAIRSFTNDSFISLDVDSTLELRDNEKRIVVNHPRSRRRPLTQAAWDEQRARIAAGAPKEPDPDPAFWYSQWTTSRATDYRWRAEDGSARWIREGWKAIERADNTSWCSCRICQRWLTKERIIRETVAAWRKRTAA